jgi:hypothetical protein
VYGVVQFSPLSITITDGKPDFSSAAALSLFNKIKKGINDQKIGIQYNTYRYNRMLRSHAGIKILLFRV